VVDVAAAVVADGFAYGAEGTMTLPAHKHIKLDGKQRDPLEALKRLIAAQVVDEYLDEVNKSDTSDKAIASQPNSPE
jgi:hypothetical protein